jgi:hypothetical protein
MLRSTTMNQAAVALLVVVLTLLAVVASAPSDGARKPLLALGDYALSGPEAGVDITNSPEGQRLIREAASRFEAMGHPRAISELVATRYAGDDVVVGSKGVPVADLRASGGGFRAAVTPGRGQVLLAGPLVSAAPYWSPRGDDCFILSRPSGSHFDACYRIYWMANDNVAGKDYWRLDFYGTMWTATGRTLDWGWLAADQDAGPVQSFVDWSPSGDTVPAGNGCESSTLNVTVLGVGGSWTYSHCEKWDVSKSATTTLGWFKNEWSWNGKTPVINADRGIALELGTKGNSGSPTYGISWNFGEH